LFFIEPGGCSSPWYLPEFFRLCRDFYGISAKETPGSVFLKIINLDHREIRKK
jgi:hypothetical protein